MGVSGWPAQRAGKYSVRRSGKLYKKRLKELRTFSRSCAATALAEFSSGLRPKQNAARWRKLGNTAMSEPVQTQSPTSATPPTQLLWAPRQMLQPIQRRKQMTVEPVASIRVRARRVDVGVVDRLDALPPAHHLHLLVRARTFALLLNGRAILQQLASHLAAWLLGYV